MEPYPESAGARDRWILARRSARPALDPRRPAGWFVEQEPGTGGSVATVLTVLLTNRECPWRCVFCDLWRHTLEHPVAPGDITAQLDQVLAAPEVREGTFTDLKLYNAGSYFDAGAIPREEDVAVAGRARGFGRLIVESHPSLVGDRCWRLRDRLAAGQPEGATRLEVAMGLETVNPRVLEALNKRVSLDQFDAAAAALGREGVGFRAFVLVQPPFEAAGEAVDWAVRSVRHALEAGARVVSLIPVRGGNGALEALQAAGRFHPPTLAMLERSMESALRVGRGLILADIWDLERFADCTVCFARRRERLRRMNLLQWVIVGPDCPVCGWTGGGAAGARCGAVE